MKMKIVVQIKFGRLILMELRSGSMGPSDGIRRFQQAQTRGKVNVEKTQGIILPQVLFDTPAIANNNYQFSNNENIGGEGNNDGSGQKNGKGKFNDSLTP
uniref:Uncharacterized protein n=1 Tax=Cannabis sativa TaxID=3483 RepID=A0A803Q677_CANSA